MPGDLHLPFYQMNTAGHCTLHAQLAHGQRGFQTPVTSCPQYCAEQCFLYPDTQHMVGRFNSLFGVDIPSLYDGAFLAPLLTDNIDRLVVDFL